MKKAFIISIFLFCIGLLGLSVISYANPTSLNNYNTSPSGSYTKLHLLNQGTSGTLNENNAAGGCFCAVNSLHASGINAGNCDTGEPTSGPGAVTYSNKGTIFADSTTGALEICKADGTVASYPGSCFNRYTAGAAVPATPCPPNYAITNPAGQNFAMTAGSPVTTWQCCQTPTGASSSIAKSGCFSIYSTTGNSVPAPCASQDPNAYDVGCDVLTSSDINTSVFKRNCCFSSSSTVPLTTTSSTCGANCTSPGSDATRNVSTIPAVNGGLQSTGTCAATYSPGGGGAPVYTCINGTFQYNGIGSCVAVPNAACGSTTTPFTCDSGTDHNNNGNGTSTSYTWVCANDPTDSSIVDCPSTPECAPGYSFNSGNCVSDAPCAGTNSSCGGPGFCIVCPVTTTCVPWESISLCNCDVSHPPDLCGHCSGTCTVLNGDMACPFGLWCVKSSCSPGTCFAGNAGDTCGYDTCGNVDAACTGICTGPNTCGGGGTAHVCGNCTPGTGCGGNNCGADACGNPNGCGTCSVPGQTCGGGGTPNVCGTPPCAAGTGCGSNNCGPDTCGNPNGCGICSGSQTCGGTGTPGVCGTPACTPGTCPAPAGHGAVCGKDTCGNTYAICGCALLSDSCLGTCQASAVQICPSSPTTPCGASTCGLDSCGTSCGSCTGGTCSNLLGGPGTCNCPPNETLNVSGACVCANNTCPADGCCIASETECNTTSNTCCTPTGTCTSWTSGNPCGTVGYDNCGVSGCITSTANDPSCVTPACDSSHPADTCGICGGNCTTAGCTSIGINDSGCPHIPGVCGGSYLNCGAGDTAYPGMSPTDLNNCWCNENGESLVGPGLDCSVSIWQCLGPNGDPPATGVCFSNSCSGICNWNPNGPTYPQIVSCSG